MKQAHRDQMTSRARTYLATTALSHGCLAAVCWFLPHTFQSASYRQLIAVLPLWLWGCGFALVAVLGAVASVRRSEGYAYGTLIFAVILTSAWASGFIASWALGGLAGPTGPIVWLTLAVKDLIQCAMPLRVPLEPVVRDLLAEDDRTRRSRRSLTHCRRA